MNNYKHSLRRMLSRREMLTLSRAAGTAIFVVGCMPKRSNVAVLVSSVPACIVSPEQTEGPYFVDEKLKRADIRTDPNDGSVKQGVPLELTLHISQVSSNGCTPLASVITDIWHCDALGVYSDVTDRNFDTVGKKFLRGYQITDALGNVQFTTIYPGWYEGRTVHIHIKIRTNVSGKNYEFTSQLYFDDAISDRVYTQAPYASKGERTLKNTDDGIFRDGGEQMLLKLKPQGQGYAASLDIGLNLT
ncbi:intradiol ring-cleavage dioxygenase [Nostoc sp. FACHB-110]|uniref:intradiol ring-cleavage dioxygenase n=1 Tax=Nostoc sp. FACHB-110 TaxID=2692834 RepID=UPI0016829948|nr:intradiol ring-cleavage dioxygenase [Nostoc sp. FACHB-110]MBD2436550.1 intradiol ring-cleavage dioxygenase [Nostoc sp. FACHB-110]